MPKKLNLTLSEFIVASTGIRKKDADEMVTEFNNGTYVFGEALIADILISVYCKPDSAIYYMDIIRKQLQTAIDVVDANLVEI